MAIFSLIQRQFIRLIFHKIGKTTQHTPNSVNIAYVSVSSCVNVTLTCKSFSIQSNPIEFNIKCMNIIVTIINGVRKR